MSWLNEMHESKPIIETDDYAAGFVMAQEIAGCVPELKARYLAQWAARLREHYCEIGRQTAELSRHTKA